MSASFWLDNSDDSIFFAPSGNLSTRSSTDSFSIDNISCLDNYPSLLLPSHSLDSLPRGDLELIKVPPCPSTTPPSRRKRTHHTFLSLVASLALPKGNRPNRRYSNVLISSPTPERLKNVPQLKPALKTWISAVPNSNPPDIAPWSPPREKPHHVWVPEGSCFPPSYLKRRLRERHGPVDSYLPSAPGDSRLTVALKPIGRSESSSRSRPLRRCASHSTHHARLPDCTSAYIPVTFSPVRMRGKLRRWSLGVPPSYISTELITRRLESQRIDAIIGTESARCDASNDSPSLPLPAIKVSTSTTTIAISLPGSPEGSTTPVPEPLAIRRGQKMLAPLTLRSPQRSAEDYPGIPTAFLGTPSAYSAHFQLTSSMARRDAESLPISDMISALRSQAASLKVSSPVQLPLDIPLSSMNSLSAASSGIIPSVSEDDWAFAHDLMSRYEGPAQDRIPSKEKHHQKQAAPIRKSVTPRSGPNPAIQRSQVRRASVPAVAPSQHNRSKSSSAPRAGPDKPKHSTGVTRQRKDSRQTTPKVGTMRYRPHPESSPTLPTIQRASLLPSVLLGY
ncbi:hypothetical protein BC827DRAFT_211185 [Russula dissimulans]|nr:hypothetical protein BC827DRAFT_211185 [Russula dissimulans]